MKYILGFGKRCVGLVRNIFSSAFFIIATLLLTAVVILVTVLIASIIISFLLVAPFLVFFGFSGGVAGKLEKFANEMKAKAGESATIHPFKKKDDDE
jgi:Flp pilus assembly protein TadB